MPKDNVAQAQKETSVCIDIDTFIENWNKNNPDLRRMTKKNLAERLGVHPMVFQRWKNNYVPHVLQNIIDLMEIGNCNFEDIVKPKN